MLSFLLFQSVVKFLEDSFVGGGVGVYLMTLMILSFDFSDLSTLFCLFPPSLIFSNYPIVDFVRSS